MSREEMGGENNQRKVKQGLKILSKDIKGNSTSALQCPLSPGQRCCLGVNSDTRFRPDLRPLLVGGLMGSHEALGWCCSLACHVKLEADVSPAPESGGQQGWEEVRPHGAWR